MKLVCVLLLVPGILGYRYFQEKVPNGSRVPHPCKANFVWHGLGHMDKDGGGMRNKFGDDFYKNGQVWDECLCRRDSDGDGMTNGEELGDPDCKWKPGETPEITALSKITHPGICDPYNSTECQALNNWDFCQEDEFVCPELEKPDVKNFTIRFDETKVPKDETTYMCQMIDLPTDGGDFHVIGSKGYIDNVNVMHHIVVTLCTDEEAALVNGAFDSPTLCNMAPRDCTGFLMGWTVGMNGYCLPDYYGYGIKGYTKAILEFHWNNPEGVTDYKDSSGMTYYYTPVKREQTISGAVYGPVELHIPPKQMSWEMTAVCTSSCSRHVMNDTTRYITEALPHMHYLGRGFVMEHWRGEERLKDLVNTDSYSYDSPVPFRFDPPIEYQPGDKIITRCFFNSMTQEKRIFFGEGTQDEMCLGFLSIYPGPAFICFGNSERSFCGLEDGEDEEENEANQTEEKCDKDKYYEIDFPKHSDLLEAYCDPDGLVCEDECRDVIDNQIYNHPCMEESSWRYIIRAELAFDKEYGVPFLHRLSSCHPYTPDVDDSKKPEKPESGGLCPDDESSGASSQHMIISWGACVMIAVMMAMLVRRE